MSKGSHALYSVSFPTSLSQYQACFCLRLRATQVYTTLRLSSSFCRKKHAMPEETYILNPGYTLIAFN